MHSSLPSSSRPRRRHGMTLIELLVVMAIIAVLMGLTALVLPSGNSRSLTTAVDQIQGWGLIAKQRAVRDKAPRGLRLIPDPTDANKFRELQYVEQPEDFVLAGFGGSTGGVSNSIEIPSKALPGTQNTARLQTSIVPGQIGTGDFLVISTNGVDQWFRITGVANPAGPVSLTFTPNYTGTPRDATFGRIVRNPKPLVGEETLKLPKSIFIDQTRSLNLGNRDIVFSPSGELIRPNMGMVILWVNYDGGPEDDGALITIQPRTGQISAVPVNRDASVGGGDPYHYARDGRSGGL